MSVISQRISDTALYERKNRTNLSQQNEVVTTSKSCSDHNNESDPSSEYSPLGLTHVMNQYLGQKFTTWVKINCLDTIPKPRNGIPRPCTVHE